ncbi:twin-arginine translocase subunit TatC [Pontixanthobacter gangjinensis]|uniref:Sec-independent protein translocase protein TatC n=1 Tax=Christiangramia aestuarii TaxID=1028746 RepID=A0A7M3SYS4_9FLAO|nr:twin-arginine translocase subunit TatC [Christiangramia aestuarii]MUP41755.1 twin-arginine translocase subunit TatC [Christiangramia aestuarii]
MERIAPQQEPGEEMSFLDHLEELRWHLIRSVLAVVIAGTIAFLFKSFIFDVLLFGPANGDFFSYRVLCKLSGFFGIDGGFCNTEMPFRIQSRTMGGQFSAHVWTSITAGFIIAFPYVIYEFWKFVAPAMHSHERRHAKGFIFVTSILFFLGVLFGYYVVTPLSINFLGKYQVSETVFNDFDLSSYISLVRASTLASGLIFELPIVIYFLTKVGVVTPQFLKTYRKYALVIVLILSAIITPPDIVSQIIVAIPVLILYEVSIIISKIMYRKEEEKLKS